MYKARWNIFVAFFGIINLPSIYTFGMDRIIYKQNPAPDGHRCGICPTYWEKICGIERNTKTKFIFDNHCVLDLYNCIEGTKFAPTKYQDCIFFGNFAYVHGFKYEDQDYGEDHIIVKGSPKNPPFVGNDDK